MLSSGMTRCLVELAMSSNAPPVLKAQALNTLACVLRNSPSNQKLMLELQTAPLLPLPPDDPEMNPDQGVGYTRLSVRPAMGVLMSLAVHGEHPVGSIESEEGWRGMGLKVRKAAVGCFECLVGGPDKEVGEGLVASMKAGVPMPNPNDEGEVPPSPGALLLSALTDYPTSGPTYDPYRPIFASLLFAHLIRSSEIAKKLAREIVFPSSSPSDDVAAPPDGEEDEEEPIGLVQVVVGNLMMAFREQVDLANRLARGDGGEGEGEGRREMTGADWSRAMVGWLIVLCTWLWDSPGTVREFLSEGANLQIVSFCSLSLSTVTLSHLLIECCPHFVIFLFLARSSNPSSSLPLPPPPIPFCKASPPSSSASATSSTGNQARSPARPSILSSTAASDPIRL
jgi:hypothetical protein